MSGEAAPKLRTDSLGWDESTLRAARSSLMGANLALNYSKNPIVIARGRGARLYDASGFEYLDCVNNVAHVGHCEPRVTAAITEQVSDLCTNSRYLSPYILDYSKRLCATLPPPLSIVYWCNSGSEANDLAMRLARAHTKKRGIICLAGAYHGHTTEVIHISPYKFARAGGAGQRPWVRVAPLPDVYSGIFRGSVNDDALGAAYAGEVELLLASFARQEVAEAAARKAAAAAAAAAPPMPPPPAIGAGGVRRAALIAEDGSGGGGEAPSAAAETAAWLAGGDDDGLTAGCGAFIAESLVSCGGQVQLPAGYLRRTYAAVRASGGVCIADEVQVGFGRVGSHMWGFQLGGADVVPDIVTLGKPVGNGFPVSLVVTTAAIAASFANGMEYFNTFGGNPVAARAAIAVLDVLEADGLQARASTTGAALLAGFEILAKRYPCIGSVRGVGLMVGLEILRTPRVGDARPPWTVAASAVVYAMRARRILLSTDGMASNVIKMKPPMVFSLDDAATVLRELEDVFEHLDEHIEAYQRL